MSGKTVDMASAEAAREQEPGKYERSTIAFPYGDLDDALVVVDAIHHDAGTQCTTEQLAAWIDQSAKSGAFRVRLSTARTFGLIESDQGTISLTSLGRQAVDPATRDRAKATAFLTVPLYARIYEKYKGTHLPPAAALQREMEGFGVAKKQTPRARQAFERSAEQSGFFRNGKGRLVEPAFRGEGALIQKDKPKEQNCGGDGGGNESAGPSLILGLVKRLPPVDTVYPSTERKKWIQAVESIFSVIYKNDDDGDNDPE